MAFPPQTDQFAGPPPGATPVGLSAIKADPMQANANPTEGEGPGGGIAKMFYSVERSLDTLAEILPNEGDQIDEIKGLLREVLARAISQGAPFKGAEDTAERGIRSGPTSEPMI